MDSLISVLQLIDSDFEQELYLSFLNGQVGTRAPSYLTGLLGGVNYTRNEKSTGLKYVVSRLFRPQGYSQREK